MSESAVTGRRELNRERTRSAIVQAAFDLGASGYENLTADAVAERAEISRRTFFNYFSSVDEAIMAPVRDFLESAISRLSARPAEEDLLEAVLSALAEDIDDESFTTVCTLMVTAQDRPSLERYELQMWHEAQSRLQEGLRSRFPADVDELFLATAAAAIFSCGKTAMDCAASRYDGSTPIDMEDFRSNLIRSIQALRSGFTSPTSRS